MMVRKPFSTTILLVVSLNSIMLSLVSCNVRSGTLEANAVHAGRHLKLVPASLSDREYLMRALQYQRLAQPFVGVQRAGLYAPIPSSGVYDPFSLAPLRMSDEAAMASNNLRSRRNSISSRGREYAPRHRPREFYYRQKPSEINDIYAAAPRQAAYSRYGSGNYPMNPNQFLTKQQIDAQLGYNAQGSIRNEQVNSVRDRKRNSENFHYGRYHGGQPSNNIDAPGGNEPWSVQVGTQLKVNHDDRQKNPDQFYVQDETGAQSYRRRPSYRP